MKPRGEVTALKRLHEVRETRERDVTEPNIVCRVNNNNKKKQPGCLKLDFKPGTLVLPFLLIHKKLMVHS